MVNLAHHHARIRRKAHAVHWGLIPLAVAVPLAWIYFALDVCQDDVSPWTMKACRVLGWTPLLPAAAGVLVAAWILRDLAVLGHAVRSQTHGQQGPGPRLHHAHHGYRALDDRHKRHVHWVVIEVVAVAAALALWLAYEAYQTTG